MVIELKKVRAGRNSNEFAIPDRRRVKLAQLVGECKQFLRCLRNRCSRSKSSRPLISPSNFGSFSCLLPSTKYVCCISGSHTSGVSRTEIREELAT